MLFAAPASLVVSAVGLVVDATLRQRWGGVDTASHYFAGSLIMATFGLVAGCVAAIAMDAVHRVRLARPRLQTFLRSLLTSGVVAMALWPTAQWMFRGAWISDHPIAPYGPAVVATVTAIATVSVYHAVAVAARAQSRGNWWGARACTAALAGAVGVAVYVDTHYYVALYTRLHSALEVAAFYLAVVAVGLVLREVDMRRPNARKVSWGFTALGATFAAATVFNATLQDAVETSLDHAWRERIYVGRQLDRLRLARAFLDDPSGYEGTLGVARDELQARYDIATIELDPRWSEKRQRSASPIDCSRCNLLIFYVDTLRHDVASNGEIMPSFRRFAAKAMNFQRTYSTGSDTLNALPGLTRGRYELADPHDGDLLKVAERLGMKRVITIPKSAHDFLTKLHPDFRFDEALEVPDYDEGEKVWGYGANKPTASTLVDRTLDWLEEHRGERFLSWVFNFELHNWREMNDEHVLQAAKRAGLPTDGNQSWRYSAIASEVDRHFGRLVDGLDRLGLADDTIVMFVSDHGEALGEWNFWVHGIVVWESVVRVPLAIRIPGAAPMQVDRPATLADVPPTLVAALGGDSPTWGYHGVNLLGLASGTAQRSLPIMFVGQRKETLVRVGMLDPASQFKLVLPLEVGRPELYDTTLTRPDEEDLSRSEPVKVAELLNWVVRSPMYPRPASRPADTTAEPTN